MMRTMHSLLLDAKKNGYAVAAPNVFDNWQVQAVFEVANALKAPIIVNAARSQYLEEIAYITRYYEKKYPDVVFALNLDHGGAFEDIVGCIRYGYSSVMIDRSELPLKENAAQVKEVVRIAHAVGVSVEAEIGHVGETDTYDQMRDAGLTDIDEAIWFARETGVDCLAVAVGTSHGAYKGTPRIEFELLSKLNDVIPVPLVLHGGSSTGDVNLQKAIQLGITKINLWTDLSNASLREMAKYLQAGGADSDGTKDEFANHDANIRLAATAAQQGFKEELSHYVCLFGGENKA